MISYESVFDSHHMMDWDLGHWIPMIFGWGFIILAVIIIFYFIIRSFNGSGKNQVITQKPKNTINHFKTFEIDDENLKNINYCSRCGEKIDGEPLNYCPKCGSKIE
ncbi:MAG: hypothetical protein ACFFCI_16480 [Promethearchaeota archaeon]